MTASLENCVLVVTGAASGIGKAIALEAAAAGAGGLALTDRDIEGCQATQADVAAKGISVMSIAADLMNPASPAKIMQDAIAHFGRADGLVNAAGLTDRASFIDGTAETWDALFTVNARAPFFLMQQFITHLKSRSAPGAVVNILSMNAHCGGTDLAIYSATKGALATLTKNAANAHMADRIRVNGINLGWVATESERRLQSEILGKGPDWETKAAAAMPLGRMLKAEEAAKLAVFLLSDASVPMSGGTIDLEQRVLGAP